MGCIWLGLNDEASKDVTGFSRRKLGQFHPGINELHMGRKATLPW